MPSVTLLYRGSKHMTYALSPSEVLKSIALLYKYGISATDEHKVTYTHLTQKAGQQSY